MSCSGEKASWVYASESKVVARAPCMRYATEKESREFDEYRQSGVSSEMSPKYEVVQIFGHMSPSSERPTM